MYKERTMKLSRFFLIFCLSFLSYLPSAYSAEANTVAMDSVSPVNINTADVQTLATGLKGIGVSKAEAIITYRETYGSFKSIEELSEIKGIGEAIIAQNRERIRLE
jgi:competence protein ComEA